MRVIFVPVADRPECARALRTAFDLGQRLGANVTGCHIRAHRDSNVALPRDLASVADYDAAWHAALKGKASKKQSKSAQLLFSAVAEKHDFPIVKKLSSGKGAAWLEKVGSPDKVLSIWGPVSDLLVVSRPSKKGGKLARLFLNAALMNSAKPVLVLPQSGRTAVGSRVSIAWNQSAEAARAVAMAMPVLQAADQVNIVTVGPEAGLGPKAGQLANYLRAWGVKSKRIAAKGDDDAEALVEACDETDSDLLVMGAYSRSRLRQRIFGGVTEYMLTRARIPVLMLHS